jgi:hypothetical protein
MSVSQNPMTGQMRKSMANFVTTTHRGQNVIRAKAFKPRNVNSDSQKIQRASFKLVVDEYQSFGGITDIGFTERPITYSPYNSFVAANLSNAVDKSGETPVIDYSKLVVSIGSLPQLVITEATVEAAGIKMSYQTLSSIPKVSETDEVVAFAKLKSGELIIARQPLGSEEVGTILIPYPNIVAANVVCCYAFAVSADGMKASKSVFITVGS